MTPVWKSLRIKIQGGLFYFRLSRMIRRKVTRNDEDPGSPHSREPRDPSLGPYTGPHDSTPGSIRGLGEFLLRSIRIRHDSLIKEAGEAIVPSSDERPVGPTLPPTEPENGSGGGRGWGAPGHGPNATGEMLHRGAEVHPDAFFSRKAVRRRSLATMGLAHSRCFGANGAPGTQLHDQSAGTYRQVFLDDDGGAREAKVLKPLSYVRDL